MLTFLLMLQAAATAATPIAPGSEEPRPAIVMPDRRGREPVLATKSGLTLYAMNARVSRSRSGAGVDGCVAACAAAWAPLAAARDAPAVGSWTVVEGAAGPQWAYQGNPVFTFRADRKGERKGENWEDLFAVIRYVPPLPKVALPAGVLPKFEAGRWRLYESNGRALAAAHQAPEGWTPLRAGFAARAAGAWTLLRDEEGARWAYRGIPVWVANDSGPVESVSGATLLTL